MHKTKKQKEELILELFSDRELFEQEVLHVSSTSDCIEVMQIISKDLVKNKLKHEISFLYLKSFDEFKLHSITKSIFNQIANEWLSYASEVLFYSKENSLLEIQEKQRVNFIYAIANDYFSKYKKYIFEEIADSFIDLVNTIPHAESQNKVVSDVLKSSLIADRNVLVIQSFNQLWSKVRAASNIKNADVSRIQILMAENTISSSKPDTDEESKEKLLDSFRKYDLELKRVSYQSLDNFDSTLKRLKSTMVSSMMEMKAI
jgi:hypothetical protein